MAKFLVVIEMNFICYINPIALRIRILLTILVNLLCLSLTAQNEEMAYQYLVRDGLRRCYASSIVEITSVDTVIQYLNSPTPFFAYKNKGDIVEYKAEREEFYIEKRNDTLLTTTYTKHDSVFTYKVSGKEIKKIYYSNNGENITFTDEDQKWIYRLNPNKDTVSVSYADSDTNFHIPYKPITTTPACKQCGWMGKTYYNTFNGHQIVEMDTNNCRLTVVTSYLSGAYDSIFFNGDDDTLQVIKYYDAQGYFYRCDVDLKVRNTDPFDFYSSTEYTYHPTNPDLYLRKEELKQSLETKSLKIYDYQNDTIAKLIYEYADGCGTPDIYTKSTGDGKYEFIIGLQKGMIPPSNALRQHTNYNPLYYTKFFHPYNLKVQYFSDQVELFVQPEDSVVLVSGRQLSMHEYLEGLYLEIDQNFKPKKKPIHVGITVLPNQSVVLNCANRKLHSIIQTYADKNPIAELLPYYKTYQYIHFVSPSNLIPPVYQDYPITKIDLKFKW